MTDKDNMTMNENTESQSENNKKQSWDCDNDAWWEDRSLPQKILIGIGFAILGVALLAAFGWLVMSLWNWLMPEIFGLKAISYWQAWGLMILSCILFKGFGSGSGGHSDRKRKRHLRSYLKQEIGDEIRKEIQKELQKEKNQSDAKESQA